MFLWILFNNLWTPHYHPLIYNVIEFILFCLCHALTEWFSRSGWEKKKGSPSGAFSWSSPPPFPPLEITQARQEINELPWWYKIACLPQSLNGLQTSKGVVIVMEGSGNNACFAALQTSSPEREGGGWWRRELSWGREKKRESRCKHGKDCAWSVRYSVRCSRLQMQQSQSLLLGLPVLFYSPLPGFIRGCVCSVCMCARIENPRNRLLPDWKQEVFLHSLIE